MQRSSLVDWITNPTLNNLYCKLCKKNNHKTDDCRHLSKQMCTTCGRIGHSRAECWTNGKCKCDSEDNPCAKQKTTPFIKNKDRCNSKKQKNRQSNVTESDEEESAVFIEQTIPPVPSYNEENSLLSCVNTSKNEDNLFTHMSTIDDINVHDTTELYNISDNEDCVSFYKNDDDLSLYVKCLADTGTTSHVFNDINLFTDYCPIVNTYIGSVGGTKTCTHGRGTICLQATHGDR